MIPRRCKFRFNSETMDGVASCVNARMAFSYDGNEFTLRGIKT